MVVIARGVPISEESRLGRFHCTSRFIHEYCVRAGLGPIIIIRDIILLVL